MGTIIAPSPLRHEEGGGKRRRENLALIYQEVMTAITRLRSGRQQVEDAQFFRTHMRNALSTAESEATSKGYPPEDVRLATFAAVAFLDESVLNSSNPAFAEWPRLPLQEEMFGHHIAGEVFFQNIEKMLARADSHNVADVLEVYLLCLLLGYQGRYSLAGLELLRPIIDSVGEKIRRIRGVPSDFSPGWAPPREAVKVTAKDAWVGRLLMIALASVVLAAILFVGFKLILSGGVSSLRLLTSALGF